MIISCPHCQTKYQVTYEAIGSAGRKVQCAQCQKAWQQAPVSEPDPSPQVQAAIEAITEDALDETLIAEEKAVAAALAKRLADEQTQQQSAAAAKIDPALIRSRQRAFSKRQDAINADQPLAKLRRIARAGLAVSLVLVGLGAFFARLPVVSRFPDLAGVYEQLGLGVNVVGLDFSDVSAQRNLRNGRDVLVVSAQIVGLNATPTPAPALIITLLDSHGDSIYAWSIAPQIDNLMAGERATFDTQLVMPPGDAERMRLSFAETGLVPTANTESEQAQSGPPLDEPHAAPAEDHPPAAGETHGGAHGTPAAAGHDEPATAHPQSEAAGADHGTGAHATPSEHH